MGYHKNLWIDATAADLRDRDITQRYERTRAMPATKDDPLTRVRTVRCGHCKGTHNSVNEVRMCYATSQRNEFVYTGPNPWTTDGASCQKCHGTGVYVWGGTINGVPIHSGQCFACGGKGRQTDCGEKAHDERADQIMAGVRDKRACCDRVRNDLYWMYGVRIY